MSAPEIYHYKEGNGLRFLVPLEDYEKLIEENAAMREVIREAASQLALTDHDPECPHLFRVLYGQDKFPCKCGRDAVLTKLQPLLKT